MYFQFIFNTSPIVLLTVDKIWWHWFHCHRRVFTLDVSKYFNVLTSKRPRLIIPYRDPTAERLTIPCLSPSPTAFITLTINLFSPCLAAACSDLEISCAQITRKIIWIFIIGHVIVKYCQLIGRGDIIIIIRLVLQYNYKYILYKSYEKICQYAKNNLKMFFTFFLTTSCY